MKNARIAPHFYLFVVLILSLFTTQAYACTGIQLKAADGSYVTGRTLEFGIPLDISALIVPRNYEFKGTLPDGSTGMVYRAKYAVVGAIAFGIPAIADGLNEKGLSAGAFYFPGYAAYGTVTAQNKNKAVAPTEFVNWLLTQFATVDEVKQAIKNVIIAPTPVSNWGGVPPFHFVVYDITGKSIAIEPMNGQLVASDNPIGVFTNSPTFDWHLTNLSNYINLSPMNAPKKSVDGYQLKQFGQGTGLRGLPGDFTPPSRFIRAAVYSNTAIPAKDAQAEVLALFHILNQFDIPEGSVRADDQGKTIAEYTLATTAKDPQNLKYYFRTHDDQTIKSIDLHAFNLEATTLQSVSMKGTQPVVDVSKTAQPGVNKGV